MKQSRGDAEMMTGSTATVSRFRLGLALWAAAMPGVVAVTANLLPRLLRELPKEEAVPMPVWVLTIVGSAQNGVILAIAVWGGVALGSSLGFRAPLFTAALQRRPLMPVLREQWIPALLGGLAGGGLLAVAWRFVPPILTPAQERLSLPLYARVLYGGITEEVFLRWGAMVALVWVGWALLQRRRGEPSAGVVWLANAVSALAFAAGHLPAAWLLAGPLDAAAVVWVVGVNGAFGLLFGFLFWKRGLEAAMIAHGLTHVVHDLSRLF